MSSSTSSRERILARIREALSQPAPPRHLSPEVLSGRETPATSDPQGWLPPVPDALPDRVALFAKNCSDLKTEWISVTSYSEAFQRIQQIAEADQWQRVAAHRFPGAEQLTAIWEGSMLWTDAGYDKMELERCDVGITTCDCLIAQTGSVLVSSKSAGGRALSVLPPHHIVLADRSHMVGDLADAFRRVRENHQGSVPAFLSFITGPSRTGDIERILVLGAHGPKRFTIVFVDA